MIILMKLMSLALLWWGCVMFGSSDYQWSRWHLHTVQYLFSIVLEVNRSRSYKYEPRHLFILQTIYFWSWLIFDIYGCTGLSGCQIQISCQPCHPLLFHKNTFSLLQKYLFSFTQIPFLLHTNTLSFTQIPFLFHTNILPTLSSFSLSHKAVSDS